MMADVIVGDIQNSTLNAMGKDLQWLPKSMREIEKKRATGKRVLGKSLPSFGRHFFVGLDLLGVIIIVLPLHITEIEWKIVCGLHSHCYWASLKPSGKYALILGPILFNC